MNTEKKIRLAAIGDIHSNHAALTCFYEYIKEHCVDGVILLGDYISDCAYPQKTLKLIKDITKEFPCIILRGNREEAMFLHRERSEEWGIGSSGGSLLYTYENLSLEDLEFFENLPMCATLNFKPFLEDIDDHFFNQRADHVLGWSELISYDFNRNYKEKTEKGAKEANKKKVDKKETNKKENGENLAVWFCSGQKARNRLKNLIQQYKEQEFPSITLCHGSPKDIRELLYYCSEAAEQTLKTISTDYLISAHTHVQGSLEAYGKKLLNPGALGSQNTADFLIITGKKSVDKEEILWQEEFYNLPYEKEMIIAEFKDSGLSEISPVWCRTQIRELLTGIKCSYPCVILAKQLYEQALEKQLYKETLTSQLYEETEKEQQNKNGQFKSNSIEMKDNPIQIKNNPIEKKDNNIKIEYNNSYLKDNVIQIKSNTIQIKNNNAEGIPEYFWEEAAKRLGIL